MPSRQSYIERRLPVATQPVQLAAALAGRGQQDNYMVYERNGEWSVALGSRFELVASAAGVSLSGPAMAREWTGLETLEAVQLALAEVPVCDWRAYGTSAFEFAYWLHGMKASGAEPFLRLSVPAIEVRIREGYARVRAMAASDLERVCQLLGALDRQGDIAAGAGRTPAADLLAARLRDAADERQYKALVSAAIRGISQRKFDKVIASRVVPLRTSVDLLATYVAGRQRNTPARSFLVAQSGMKFAGFSPETVLEVTADGTVTTQPLAGTRALVADAGENERLRSELLRDVKELAEHAMSVKVAFEELGRFCREGSVGVTDFMSVSHRGSVQHLASRVSGRLAAGRTAWAAFRELFPAVTASGIPKRQAMEWIRCNEAERRGLYAGAVLTVDADGAMDAALVLRTIFQRGQEVWLRAGAGIVAQSDPDREFEETCEKLQSVASHLVLAS